MYSTLYSYVIKHDLILSIGKRVHENPLPPDAPYISRITVGGDSNRWLNISRIELVGGAEDPDSKLFECEVCTARDTPLVNCSTAKYTNLVIGGPPVIKETNSKNLRF